MGEIEYHITYSSIKMKLKHVSGYRYKIDKEKPRTQSVRQMRVYANISQPDSPCAARKKLLYFLKYC